MKEVSWNFSLACLIKISFEREWSCFFCSKVNIISFLLLRWMASLKKCEPFFIQWESKAKPIIIIIIVTFQLFLLWLWKWITIITFRHIVWCYSGLKWMQLKKLKFKAQHFNNKLFQSKNWTTTHIRSHIRIFDHPQWRQ